MITDKSWIVDFKAIFIDFTDNYVSYSVISNFTVVKIQTYQWKKPKGRHLYNIFYDRLLYSYEEILLKQ